MQDPSIEILTLWKLCNVHGEKKNNIRTKIYTYTLQSLLFSSVQLYTNITYNFNEQSHTELPAKKKQVGHDFQRCYYYLHYYITCSLLFFCREIRD